MYQVRRRVSGFTLVELMLAMTFIAILLISIAMLSLYLISLYDRGSTMKDINQAGTEIASDIKRSIAASTDDFPKKRKYKLSTTPSNLYVDVVCTGSVSYVANRGDSLELLADIEPDNPLIKSNGEAVRLAKVDDTGGSLCNRPDDSTWPSNMRNLNQNVRELLSQEVDHTLSVWGLEITSYPNASTPELTTVLLTIGTSESADIDFSGSYPTCNAGNGSEWCGINTFEIVGRSGNSGAL